MSKTELRKIQGKNMKLAKVYFRIASKIKNNELKTVEAILNEINNISVDFIKEDLQKSIDILKEYNTFLHYRKIQEFFFNTSRLLKEFSKDETFLKTQIKNL